MKHIYIIVEGQTELEFANKFIIPFLLTKGISTHMQAIMVTMPGGGHGYNHIEHFKRTITPVLSYKDEPIITTMFDHYGINSVAKMPNYADCAKKTNVEDRIQCLENGLNDVVQAIMPYRFFIPNIIRHEFETLLFADPKEGFSLEDDIIINELLAICNLFPNIEDINVTPQGAPSKRIDEIYAKHSKKYNKVADGMDIIELTGLDTILEKCPRLNDWLERLIAMAKAES
ncbi:MAG: DUF4276 family protein [Saprospiraceae bacterium]